MRGRDRILPKGWVGIEIGQLNAVMDTYKVAIVVYNQTKNSKRRRDLIF